jgi:hypothetical protein
VAGRIRSIEKSNDLIGNRTRNLPACSRVPQPTTLPHAPKLNDTEVKDKCQVKISNRFAGIENLDDKLDINRASESIKKIIKT